MSNPDRDAIRKATRAEVYEAIWPRHLGEKGTPA